VAGGPGPRYGSSVAYDPAGPAMLLFGGADYDVSNDVWSLSLGGSPAWTQLNPAGSPPGERFDQTAAFDPTSRRLMMFGGYSEYGDVLGDLWVLDLSGSPSWSPALPTPTVPFRYGAGWTVGTDGRFSLYGGADSYGKVLADIWSIPTATPTTWKTWEILLPPRLQEAMVLDTQRDRLVAFGGTDGAYRNDTYGHSMIHGPGCDLV